MAEDTIGYIHKCQKFQNWGNLFQVILWNADSFGLIGAFVTVIVMIFEWLQYLFHIENVTMFTVKIYMGALLLVKIMQHI